MDSPNPGDPLSVEQIEALIEVIRLRQFRNRAESTPDSIRVALATAGERYKLVRCINGEFTGMKGELPVSQGVPRCPNGHVLLEDLGLRLGWVDERRMDDGGWESSPGDSLQSSGED